MQTSTGEEYIREIIQPSRRYEPHIIHFYFPSGVVYTLKHYLEKDIKDFYRDYKIKRNLLGFREVTLLVRFNYRTNTIDHYIKNKKQLNFRPFKVPTSLKKYNDIMPKFADLKATFELLGLSKSS